MDQDVEDLLDSDVNKVYGRCRCCLDLGYVKNMWTEYSWEGAQEIYGEMLMETFSIAWDSTLNGKEQICDACVTRLRDAHMFKREVLASEHLLKDRVLDSEAESVKNERLSDLDQYENTTEAVIGDPEYKGEVEEPCEEEFVIDDDVEYEEVEYLDEEIIPDIKDANESIADVNNPTPDAEQSSQTQSVGKPKRKRTHGLNTRNYRNYSEDTLRQSIEAALKSDKSISEVAAQYGVPRKTLTARVYNVKHGPKPDDPETLEKDVDKCGYDAAPGDLGTSLDRKLRPRKTPFEKTDIDKYRDNVKTILTCSNATLFRSQGTSYSCFFCRKVYSSASDLKIHTLTHSDISKAYNFKLIYDFSINLDITNLKCLICEKSIYSYEYLLTHLKEHRTVIHMDIKNQILPFRFDTDELTCVVCYTVFGSIRKLTSHMNEHYKNYECDQCSKPFINKDLLKAHKLAGRCPNKKVEINRDIANNSMSSTNTTQAEQTEKKPVPFSMEVDKYRDNVKSILTWSNATPFKIRGTDYTCFFCKKEYSSTRELKVHTLSIHTNKSLAHKFKSIFGFSLKLDVTDLTCLVCKKGIDNFERLLTHLKNHGKPVHTDINNQMIPFKFDTDQFECALCDKVFEFFKPLCDHTSEHYRNYECDKCSKAFLKKSLLYAHKKVHLIGEFKCIVCPKKFDTKVRRDQHQRVVHILSNRSHKCWKCDIFFQDWIQKAKHNVEVHGATPRKFRCNACDRTFDSKRSVRVHNNSYHLMRKRRNHLKCSECPKTFDKRYRLEIHMAKHTGLKNIECPYCNKTFGHLSYLRQHLKIHNEDEKFQCERCSKKFSQKQSLRYHMHVIHNSYE